MKDIAQKDLPDVSGGILPSSYLPQSPVDVGGDPLEPIPEPRPSPDGPQPFILEN